MRQLNSSNKYGSGSKTTKGEGKGAGFKAKKIGFSSITQIIIIIYLLIFFLEISML